MLNAKATKMDAAALGEAWGPILMRPREVEAAKVINDAAHQINAVRLLITRCRCGGLSEIGGDSGEVVGSKVFWNCVVAFNALSVSVGSYSLLFFSFFLFLSLFLSLSLSLSLLLSCSPAFAVSGQARLDGHDAGGCIGPFQLRKH